MTKVVVFENWWNPKHCAILRALAEGIPGSIVTDVREYNDCDIAVIFGTVKRSYEPTWAKQPIIDNHKGRSLIVVESAFVKRGQYWQVGFGGTAGNADFNCNGVPFDRWLSFGVRGKPWQDRKDSPVVVCGQLLRDTQVQDVDHIGWLIESLLFFDNLGVEAFFRPHPKSAPNDYERIPKRFFSDAASGPLSDVLNWARCFVTWNSTSAVDAIINGIPVMVCDPSSIAWKIGTKGLVNPDNLKFPERKTFLSGLGYSQWSMEEMKQGLPWQHLMRQ